MAFREIQAPRPENNSEEPEEKCYQYACETSAFRMARAYGEGVDYGKRAAVLGGNNIAVETARALVRSGVDGVNIIYPRPKEEMPAHQRNIEDAEREGVKFLDMASPLNIGAKDGGLVIELVRMELGEPDASGRRRPIPIEGSEFIIDVDTVVVSVGVSPNPLIPQSMKDLDVSSWGTILVDKESMQSSVSDIFAGGDIVRGGATVILAMGDGRKSTAGMHEYIQKTLKKKMILFFQ